MHNIFFLVTLYSGKLYGTAASPHSHTLFSPHTARPPFFFMRASWS
jgi:hypothetical protein